MTESKSHKRAKAKAAGKNEVRISKNRRLDSASTKRATEVERSGDQKLLDKAVQRLKDSGRLQKVLQVPNQDFGKATEAMRKKKVSGTIKNMGGTRRRHIPRRS